MHITNHIYNSNYWKNQLTFCLRHLGLWLQAAETNQS